MTGRGTRTIRVDTLALRNCQAQALNPRNARAT